MLKRNHLRQFIAVAETGGFTSAARALNLTQPTLSAGIAELERIVGAPLLRRERRQVRLTPAGVRLLAHARAIEREFRLAESPAGDLPGPRPPLRLGLLASLPGRAIERLARELAQEGPLALTEGSDADLRRRLKDGRIDAAVTLLRSGEPAPAAIEEGYRMLLPESHERAGAALLSPLDVAGEAMVARRSCELLAETSRFFTAHGVRPQFLLRSANEERCLAMVAAGLAVTTGPASLAGGGIVAVPLEGYDFTRRLGIVAGPDGPPAALAEAWAGLVREWDELGTG